MSALPPKADIPQDELHVRFVPKADIASCCHLIESNARGKPYWIVSCSSLKPL